MNKEKYKRKNFKVYRILEKWGIQQEHISFVRAGIHIKVVGEIDIIIYSKDIKINKLPSWISSYRLKSLVKIQKKIKKHYRDIAFIYNFEKKFGAKDD